MSRRRAEESPLAGLDRLRSRRRTVPPATPPVLHETRELVWDAPRGQDPVDRPVDGVGGDGLWPWGEAAAIEPRDPTPARGTTAPSHRGRIVAGALALVLLAAAGGAVLGHVARTSGRGQPAGDTAGEVPAGQATPDTGTTPAAGATAPAPLVPRPGAAKPSAPGNAALPAGGAGPGAGDIGTAGKPVAAPRPGAGPVDAVAGDAGPDSARFGKAGRAGPGRGDHRRP